MQERLQFALHFWKMVGDHHRQLDAKGRKMRVFFGRCNALHAEVEQLHERGRKAGFSLCRCERPRQELFQQVAVAADALLQDGGLLLRFQQVEHCGEPKTSQGAVVSVHCTICQPLEVRS